MARPLRIQFPGALYHLTNRGNERKPIFRDDDDRRAFLEILQQALDTYSVVLHSFVLMSNHWHFLAQTPLGNLSEFMRYFNITYTSHFNRRHKRSGHLYQGRYKSILVEEDAYLLQVSRYIHLNPVRVSGLKSATKDKQAASLFAYHWSSLPGYIDTGKQVGFVLYDTVLGDYGGNTEAGRAAYKQQIADDLGSGLTLKPHIVGQTALGSERFISWLKTNYLDHNQERERPAVKKIHVHLSQEAVVDCLEKLLGEELVNTSGTDRHIMMSMLYKYVGLKNHEIGELCNCDYSTVSQARKRLLVQAGKDERLRHKIEVIEGVLSRIVV